MVSMKLWAIHAFLGKERQGWIRSVHEAATTLSSQWRPTEIGQKPFFFLGMLDGVMCVLGLPLIQRQA